MGRKLGIVGVLIALGIALVAVQRGLEGPKQNVAPSIPSGTVDGERDEAEFLDPLQPDPSPSDEMDRSRVGLPTEGKSPDVATLPLEVLVLGLEGNPVEGASVRQSRRQGDPVQVTDRNGLVTLTMPRKRTNHVLRAEYGDLVAIPQRVESTQGSATLRLVTTETLRGIVLESQSEDPIGSAEVSISDRRGAFNMKGRSDGSGRISFERVPRGIELSVRASAPGHISTIWNFATEADPTVSTPALEVRLERAVVLSGTVVDAISGAPIPGAKVTAGPGSHLHRRTCDELGEFRYEEMITVRTDEVRFFVGAPGFVSIEGLVQQDDWNDPLRIRLPPSARLLVRVFDSAGEPVESARIHARTPSHFEPIEPPESLRTWVDEGWLLSGDSFHVGDLRSDSPGHEHEVDRIPYCAPVRVTAIAQGYERVSTQSAIAGAPGSIETLDLTLAVEPPAPERGRIQGILRLNGAPTPGQVHWTSNRTMSSGNASSDGSYSLSHILPGTVTLKPIPSCPGLENLFLYFNRGMPFEGHTTTVELDPGGALEVDLDVKIPMGTLSGLLSTVAGQPVSGRRIHIESLSHPDPRHALSIKVPLAQGSTDSEGRFEFVVPTELAPFRIEFVHGGKAHTREVPSAPTEGIDFELPMTRAIEVRDLGPNDRFMRRLTGVHVRSSESPDFRPIEPDLQDSGIIGFRTTENGEMDFELPLGTYDFLIGDPAGSPLLLESVEISDAPHPHEIEVRLEPVHQAAFHLAESTDSPPMDLTVLILEADRWDSVRDPEELGGQGSPYPATTPAIARRVRFRGDHRAADRNLPPGRYRFKVFPPDITIEPEWIDMPSRDTSFEIRWE